MMIDKNMTYGVKQASTIVGVSRATMYKYMRLGYIKYKVHKYNNRAYITGSELYRFINS